MKTHLSIAILFLSFFIYSCDNTPSNNNDIAKKSESLKPQPDQSKKPDTLTLINKKPVPAKKRIVSKKVKKPVVTEPITQPEKPPLDLSLPPKSQQTFEPSNKLNKQSPEYLPDLFAKKIKKKQPPLLLKGEILQNEVLETDKETEADGIGININIIP